MINAKLIVVVCSTVALLISGCSGTRHSYESLLDAESENPVIVLKVGDKREVLAVGNGFPGWWGWYPAIVSQDQSVAIVECESARSFIPFREPGILFGGEVCYLKAQKIGLTWLFFGNKYTMQPINNEMDLERSTEDELHSPLSDYADKVITLKVVPNL